MNDHPAKSALACLDVYMSSDDESSCDEDSSVRISNIDQDKSSEFDEHIDENLEFKDNIENIENLDNTSKTDKNTTSIEVDNSESNSSNQPSLVNKNKEFHLPGATTSTENNSIEVDLSKVKVEVDWQVENNEVEFIEIKDKYRQTVTLDSDAPYSSDSSDSSDESSEEDTPSENLITNYE